MNATIVAGGEKINVVPSEIQVELDGRLLPGFGPEEFTAELRALIARITTPLAVRSSSLLEDALKHPFAGVYATKMVPNAFVLNRLKEAGRAAAHQFLSDHKSDLNQKSTVDLEATFS